MKKLMAKKLLIINYSLLIIILASCSITKQISKQANATLLKDSAVNTGHIGISIYDPETQKYWYNNNATQYFIPASNAKLFTLYAGMKYLGDSLVAARYDIVDDTLIALEPSGDPTFLNKEFSKQNLFAFLKNFKEVEITPNRTTEFPKYGYGWAWDDFLETYMPLKSEMPIFNNLVTFSLNNDTLSVIPKYFKVNLKDYKLNSNKTQRQGIDVKRRFSTNDFWIFDDKNKSKQVSFYADILTVSKILSDTLQNFTRWMPINLRDLKYKKIHSQPSDSLFKPMMHRSDNFYAEQTLLMASNEYLGFMSDDKIIDTILKTNLKILYQRPKWVDGSGLSRYNLFTPQSFVQILNQLKLEFGLTRLQTILPTGGEGTLSSYFKKYAGNIYAKTGTLSNNCALSGYLITKKGKLLIFSILNNNYITGATPIRKAVEKFLGEVIEKY